MARITIQKPTDQPTNRNRLLDALRAALGSDEFTEFRLMVAFAKVGPLLRLSADIARWCRAGKGIEAIIGIDQNGTSKEALQFALENFTATTIAHVTGGVATFHPKLYLFTGPEHVRAFVGSNNLTVGGTETNLETHLRIEMELPADAELHNDLLATWDDAQAVGIPLTATNLAQFEAASLVLPEAQTRRRSSRATTTTSGATAPVLPVFPTLAVRPPSPVPRAIAQRRGATNAAGPTPSPIMRALVMQINPHRNGEVFLSMRAVYQDPAFFGWPFTGETTPKKGKNVAYPQASPDPIVDLRVIDAHGVEIIRHNPFALNTVFYERNREIRVTVPPDVVHAVPDNSILVMSRGESVDYEMTIYLRGSAQYTDYLQRCNQQMPSGGRRQARRFGWI
jgi:HKD family nuclease